MATSGIWNGASVGVYLGGVIVGFSRNCTLEAEHDLRNIAPVNNGKYKSRMRGAYDWAASASGFVTLNGGAPGSYINNLWDKFDQGYDLTLKIGTLVSGDIYWEGQAFITSFSLEAANEESATYSISFKGSGPLTAATQA